MNNCILIWPSGVDFSALFTTFLRASVCFVTPIILCRTLCPDSQMSLSRSPSPLPNGGWTSRGLTDRSSTPNSIYSNANGFSNNDDQWAAAKARSVQIRGRPSIQTKNEGFFQRSKRKISTLPVFNSPYTPLSSNWKDPEKLGRSRWTPRGEGGISKLKTFIGNVLRKFKFFFIILSLVTLTTLIMSQTSENLLRGLNPRSYANVTNRCTRQIPQQFPVGWRQQIRYHPWGQRGRRSHGMEGPEGMGHRKGQCQE